MRLTLIPHRDQPHPAVRIAIEVSRPHSGLLVLAYSLTGKLATLRLPPARESMRADDLWQHTCFEAFVGMATGYCEYNFAPSTAWAAYRFDDYRAGMRDADVAPPRIETRTAPGRFDLNVEIALPGEGPLGLSAVIEERNGAKSWWALAHPPGDPDFHHADCFALELPAAEAP